MASSFERRCTLSSRRLIASSPRFAISPFHPDRPLFVGLCVVACRQNLSGKIRDFDGVGHFPYLAVSKVCLIDNVLRGLKIRHFERPALDNPPLRVALGTAHSSYHQDRQLSLLCLAFSDGSTSTAAGSQQGNLRPPQCFAFSVFYSMAYRFQAKS